MNIERINNKVMEYLKTESGCIRAGSSEYYGLKAFTFELINPSHSTKEIRENVSKILYDFPEIKMSGCERIEENVVKVTYKVKT